MWFDLFKAFALGLIEGLTEFLPVSSIGHLLLVQRFFGFEDEDFGKTFALLIQLGAILALLSIYFLRLWRVPSCCGSISSRSRRGIARSPDSLCRCISVSGSRNVSP